MALSQSALLDLVEELKTTDASELMRRMLAKELQELVDAEASGARLSCWNGAESGDISELARAGPFGARFYV